MSQPHRKLYLTPRVTYSAIASCLGQHSDRRNHLDGASAEHGDHHTVGCLRGGPDPHRPWCHDARGHTRAPGTQHAHAEPLHTSAHPFAGRVDADHAGNLKMRENFEGNQTQKISTNPFNRGGVDPPIAWLIVIVRITERLWRLELQLLDSIFPRSFGRDQPCAQISKLSWAQDKVQKHWEAILLECEAWYFSVGDLDFDLLHGVR